MNQLHASKTVAAKVREKRQELHWSIRELAEKSGLSEDIVEAIENDRRRRGVTVDELMILAQALGTLALFLLPDAYDYFTDEQKRARDERAREWEAGSSAREAEQKARMETLEELPKFMNKIDEFFRSIPRGAVVAVEQDGKLVPVEEPTRFLNS